MTPRGTDWGLAALTGLLAVTGFMTWFAATPAERWVFVVHDIAALALAAILVWKFRRVWRRIVNPDRWDGRTGAGLTAALLVGLTLVSGVVWATAGHTAVAGYTVLAWHALLGGLLAAVVLGHALGRAKRPRRHDLADRRQFLTAAGVAALAAGTYLLQRPVSRAVGLDGGRRRFTGSSDIPKGEFPVTSWIADDPDPLDADRWRLRVDGTVDQPLELTAAELETGDDLVATLDCTGGFSCTRRWTGIRLDALVDRAGPRTDASHVRIHSVTGYRASFPLAEAAGMLLATRLEGEPLGHGHGAPARLVAPQRRGFQWVKWVTRVEVADGPDPGAIASTIWSSIV